MSKHFPDPSSVQASVVVLVLTSTISIRVELYLVSARFIKIVLPRTDDPQVNLVHSSQQPMLQFISQVPINFLLRLIAEVTWLEVSQHDNSDWQ